MTYEFIRYQKRDRIALVTIDRPEVMNALHHEANLELCEIVDDFAADTESWVLIITGAGERAFCAGNDLKATAEESREKPTAPRSVRFGGITSQFACTKPVIAAVNGVAVGGGTEMVLACDIVVAAEHARFGLPEPRIGLIAGAGGIQRLIRQVPYRHAMGMLLTGRMIEAAEAARIGLVNEVVPAEDVLPAAFRWAEALLECSPIAVRLTKEAVQEGHSLSVEDAIARDLGDVLPRLFASPDFVEGPRAFAEKRAPRWTGA
jgi:crotonobetainyl-CoA hydratase